MRRSPIRMNHFHLKKHVHQLMQAWEASFAVQILLGDLEKEFAKVVSVLFAGSLFKQQFEVRFLLKHALAVMRNFELIKCRKACNFS